jgi:MYND finger
MGKAGKNPKKNGRRMKVNSAGSHTESHPHPAAAATAPPAAVASAVDDTAATSASAVTCTHGAVGRATAAFQVRTAAIAKYTELCAQKFGIDRPMTVEEIYVNGGVEGEVFFGFWNANSQLVDEIMIKMVYAKAADNVIRGEYKTARNECRFAGNLELFREELRDDEAIGILGRTRTERDTILSLTKLIPCSCLKKAKKDHKKWQATDICHVCGVEDSQENIFICGGCKLCGYCSKDCQKAHWNAGHKLTCGEHAKANHW